MAKNKQQPIATAAAAPAAPLTSIKGDARLAGLQAELVKAEKQLEHVQQRLTLAQAQVKDSKAARDKAESRFLADRIPEQELLSARAAHDIALREEAIAKVDVEDAQHLVDMLPAAILEAKQAAMTIVRDNLRTLAAEKAQRLVAILAEARVVSDELLAIHDQALTEFPVNSLLRLPCGGLLGAEDLGESGGFVTTAAGIPNLHSPWLTNDRARQQPSMFDLWQREVERYLSVSPAERAAQDTLNRVNALKQAKEREREERAKELAYQKWCNQGFLPYPLLNPVAPPRASQLGADEAGE